MFKKFAHYPFEYESTVGEDICFWIMNISEVITLSIYAYLSTKYIDFEHYLRALMYGCNVVHKFDKMSYFITRSWYYKEVEESDDDETVVLTAYYSSDQASQLLEEDKANIFQVDVPTNEESSDTFHNPCFNALNKDKG